IKERERFMKDTGMSEARKIPVSGLSEKQLDLLDPEYLKSLEVVVSPLPTVPEEASPSAAPATPVVPEAPQDQTFTPPSEESFMPVPELEPNASPMGTIEPLPS